ncbi:ankyrin repeat domain-containing protein [Aliikangiella sp. IMCC44359]|uniref:ankyrin repeat domain-containing protein n=1 Tax=Aliikangiella sp. IMCC44359 TaxID=3459125 RepID=UPI00403ACEA4
MNKEIVIIYGLGHDWNFKVFSDSLKKRLLNISPKSNIATKEITTDIEFFNFLAAWPTSRPIDELHIFSHSIGAGLYLNEYDNRKMIQRKKYHTKILFLLFCLLQGCSTATESQSNSEDLLLKSALFNQKQKVNNALNNGANINARDDSGRTALAWSVANLNIELIKLLVSKGAQVKYEGASQENLLHIALSTRVSMPPIKKNFQHKPADLSQRYLVTQYLLSLNIDLNKADEHGALPIHYAAALKGDTKKHIQLLTLLVKHGANLTHKNNYGFTPEDMAENPKVKSWFMYNAKNDEQKH